MQAIETKINFQVVLFVVVATNRANAGDLKKSPPLRRGQRGGS